MNILLKMFKRPLKKILIREMKSNQEELVKAVNEKLDLPKLTEEDEAKLLTSIYDAVEEAVITALDRI